MKTQDKFFTGIVKLVIILILSNLFSCIENKLDTKIMNIGTMNKILNYKNSKKDSIIQIMCKKSESNTIVFFYYSNKSRYRFMYDSIKYVPIININNNDTMITVWGLGTIYNDSIFVASVNDHNFLYLSKFEYKKNILNLYSIKNNDCYKSLMVYISAVNSDSKWNCTENLKNIKTYNLPAEKAIVINSGDCLYLNK